MSDSEEKNPWCSPNDPIHMQKVETQLAKDGISVEGFRHELINSCSIVAGSYVLRALIESEVKWEANDIDVWVPYTESWFEGNFHEFLSSQGYKFEKGQWTKNGDYDRFQREIAGFYNYSKPNSISIQILITKTVGEVLSFIRNFDLDICRLYYTGYTVGGYDVDPGKIPKEVSFSLECDQTLCDYKRSLRRIIKYKYRGFKPTFGAAIRAKLTTLIQYSKWFIPMWNDQAKNHDAIPLLVPLNNEELIFLNASVYHD